MNVLKNLWWFVLCTLLFACVWALANSESLFYDHAVAKVEKTEKGNLLLRRPDLLIYLHPNDFDTFSPHVGKWVKVSQFYRENKTDKPPEAIKPGDVFSAPGTRLIQVLPDPPLRIWVHLAKNHYEIGESITIDIHLRNTSSEEVKLYTRQSDDPRFKTRVPIIISVKKIGKWHKLKFYDILYSKRDSLFLVADKLLVKEHIDITPFIDGPGSYRVSAIYSGSFRVFSRLVDLPVSPKQDLTTASENSTDRGIIATAEDYSWPEYEIKDFATFTEYFEAMIPHIKTGHDPSKKKQSYEHFRSGAFSDLKPYIIHENQRVRILAYQYLLTFLQQENRGKARQEMFISLLQGLNDPNESVRQYVARRMNTFGSHLFNAEAKAIVLSHLKAGSKNRHTFKHIILAAGLINDKEAVPVLKKIDDEYSHFALARMGEKKSLSRVLSKFPKKPTVDDMDVHLFWRLKRLAYAKQPEAIELIIKYLHSNVVRPGANDYPPDSLAGWAAEALVDLIRDIPIKPWQARSDKSVRMCRRWIKKNYSRNKVPKIFPGEIQRWR